MGLHSGRILIVDDEKVNRDILSLLLEENETIAAKDGEQAIKRAMSSNPPDLILLDVVMPGMDGYEVCRHLKEDEKTKHIPVIFITVKSTVAEETKGLELGAVDYISKPFSPAIVKARVENHMELKKQRDLLEKLNVTDGLTGIFNRRHFDEYLEQQWRIASRTDSFLSLVMMDIDKFKQFNDNYGHAVGDECLINVAAALAQSADRDIDLIARYGGEEFVAVLPGTNHEGALQVAEEMRSKVEGLKIRHEYSTVNDHVTMSLGVATCQGVSNTQASSLVVKADKALYQAKDAGRNRVESFLCK